MWVKIKIQAEVRVRVSVKESIYLVSRTLKNQLQFWREANLIFMNENLLICLSGFDPVSPSLPRHGREQLHRVTKETRERFSAWAMVNASFRVSRGSYPNALVSLCRNTALSSAAGRCRLPTPIHARNTFSMDWLLTPDCLLFLKVWIPVLPLPPPSN